MAEQWHIGGTYLESCNCEAICPCRRIGGRAGERSSYGVCEGALSWTIARGRAGDVDLSGLAAVLACRYDDDDDGELLRVSDGPLGFEVSGRCAYQSTFYYSA